MSATTGEQPVATQSSPTYTQLFQQALGGYLDLAVAKQQAKAAKAQAKASNRGNLASAPAAAAPGIPTSVMLMVGGGLLLVVLLVVGMRSSPSRK